MKNCLNASFLKHEISRGGNWQILMLSAIIHYIHEIVVKIKHSRTVDYVTPEKAHKAYR